MSEHKSPLALVQVHGFGDEYNAIGLRAWGTSRGTTTALFVFLIGTEAAGLWVSQAGLFAGAKEPINPLDDPQDVFLKWDRVKSIRRFHQVEDPAEFERKVWETLFGQSGPTSTTPVPGS